MVASVGPRVVIRHIRLLCTRRPELRSRGVDGGTLAYLVASPLLSQIVDDFRHGIRLRVKAGRLACAYACAIGWS